ncbi:MAG: hypothetical protein EPO07_13305 [Verrucomicrobia bacterium]|nr:MAG: hypothetical protein EPO07_13305 [Verrucomicrobiota bacterium]
MRRSQRLSNALKGGGFSLHFYVRRWLRVGFVTQCCIVTAIPVIAVLICSAIDGSLFLSGRNIGLLEHPAIWAFFGIQIALPIAVRHSLKELLKARTNLRALGVLNAKPVKAEVAPLVRFLNLQDRKSKLVAAILYGFGLAAFVWNTYQNQLPGIVIPYDFWDSKTYHFGFWITRVYKFYLFVWLLPYVALLHIAMLAVALGLVRSARLSGKLKLQPFHPDGVGGLGFLPELVTRPLIVAVMFGTLPSVAAFYVHRAADVTPVMGLSVLLFGIAIAYFVPILALRNDIVAAKRTMIEKLRWQQQASFVHVFENRKVDFEALKSGNESIECFEKLCAAIKNVSNYPHLRRLIGLITLAMTPAVSSLLGKLYEDLAPVIQPWLTKP